jgi:hypothetical protein
MGTFTTTPSMITAAGCHVSAGHHRRVPWAQLANLDFYFVIEINAGTGTSTAILGIYTRINQTATRTFLRAQSCQIHHDSLIIAQEYEARHGGREACAPENK